jgi:predicted RNA-binding Zn-ribbon protein involved in translation (DUF1610 family)
MKVDPPEFVAWHEHKRRCRACTQRLAGGNRIQEIPCPAGYPLLRAAICRADSIEVDRRIARRRKREIE